jgi:RNA polymerase sigma-70 factor (ECF subfamily)
MDRDGASRMAADHERGLVARAREDSAAFAELYDFYLPRLYGFIYRRVQDRCVAEDLTSMTFQRALENVRRPDFRNDCFGGWLYRVASNVVVDHVRRDGRFVAMGDQHDAEAPGDLAIDALAAALDRDQVRRALLSLSNGHREILVLRFYDDLNTTEMCAVLGCSRETLAVRLHRALRALRMAVAKESADVA